MDTVSSPFVWKFAASLTVPLLAAMTGGALHMYLFSIPLILEIPKTTTGPTAILSTRNPATIPGTNPAADTTGTRTPSATEDNVNYNSSPKPTTTPPATAHLMLRQFRLLIALGARYMQPSSQLCAIVLILTSLLLYCDPEMSPDAGPEKWKCFASAGFVLAQTAWWERVFVFPVNERLVGLLGEGEGKEKGGLKVGIEVEEVVRDLEEWRRWHLGRVVLPGLATGLAMWGLVV